MSDSIGLRRRRLLATAAGLAVTGSLAGCTESDDPETTGDTGTDDSEANGNESGTAGNETATDGSETGTGEDELDLREANVVGVAFEGGDGSYSFDVTLHHDDDGEDGYANWWQVERLDGTQLGRRKLSHPHSRQPFTRSETVEIPDDVDCVVVRGHDQTHGYGGRAMVVSLSSGEMRTVDQGRERQSVDDCP